MAESPFKITQSDDGLSVRYEFYAYVSEEECKCILGYIEQLEAENEKLRKLVRGLWYCTENENKALCEGCPLGTVEGDRLALACEKLMRELGIEV